jgi:hypothetical protein
MVAPIENTTGRRWKLLRAAGAGMGACSGGRNAALEAASHCGIEGMG